MKIVKYEYKSIDNYQGYVEIYIDEPINRMFFESYEEALHLRGSYTSFTTSGRPTVDRVRFKSQSIITNVFPMSAISEFDKFKAEFEPIFEDAVNVYFAKLDEIERAKKAREEESKALQQKIEEINRKINL